MPEIAGGAGGLAVPTVPRVGGCSLFYNQNSGEKKAQKKLRAIVHRAWHRQPKGVAMGLQEEGQEGPQCCLCPVSGGALKKTTEPGLWCHAACMQWIPEVTVEDLNRMEPVSHIKSIQKERWDLNCSVCR